MSCSDGEREDADSEPANHRQNPSPIKPSNLSQAEEYHIAGCRKFMVRLSAKSWSAKAKVIIDKAWGNIYAFTDATSGEVICYP